ncbi:MAG: hypothetical protein E6I94_11705 [Chloroflexi bacterium]|nr:MAG: hypothetical protein E6I94_11705 [Chloroflexota bacterium]
MHFEADVIGAAQSRLAGVETHPYPNTDPARPGLCGKCPLSLDGRCYRIRGSLEYGEEAVALGADLRPAGVGDRRAEDPAVLPSSWS